MQSERNSALHLFDGLGEVDAEVVVGIEAPGDGDQGLSEVGVDAPVALLVGVRGDTTYPSRRAAIESRSQALASRGDLRNFPPPRPCSESSKLDTRPDIVVNGSAWHDLPEMVQKNFQILLGAASSTSHLVRLVSVGWSGVIYPG